MLTTRELEILNTMARINKPLLATQIAEETKGLSQSTASAVIKKLLEHGLIEVTGVKLTRNVMARVYGITDLARQKALEHLKEQYQMCNNLFSAEEAVKVIQNNTSL